MKTNQRCKQCDAEIAWQQQEDPILGMRWIPRNPQDNKDHRNTCPFGRKQWKAKHMRKFVELSNARRGLSTKPKTYSTYEIVNAIEAKLRAKSNTTASTCKFCSVAIEWREQVPFNLDGTRHASRCAGRPTTQIKNVMESMVREARASQP